MLIDYDDFRNYLIEQTVVDRVFGDRYDNGWACNCPLVSYVVERCGMPSGHTAFTGSQLTTFSDDGTHWVALPDDQQPDELFWNFARLVDDIVMDGQIKAFDALSILEAVV